MRNIIRKGFPVSGKNINRRSELNFSSLSEAFCLRVSSKAVLLSVYLLKTPNLR